ncbi:MAG: hypothetical protein QOD72_2805 [Acidimicrobiaceae bacterium]|nr:hypothetical protein [Acidimicrobiaceae bacterium]
MENQENSRLTIDAVRVRQWLRGVGQHDGPGSREAFTTSGVIFSC